MAARFGGAGMPLCSHRAPTALLRRPFAVSTSYAASSAYFFHSTGLRQTESGRPRPSRLPTQRYAANGWPAGRRSSSAWSAAVSVASNIVSNAINQATKTEMAVDPLRVVAKEMKYLIGDVRKLLGSGHPSLDRAAKYYTQAEGKHMRPLIVLLMSRATFVCPKAPQSQLPAPEPVSASASAPQGWTLSPSTAPPLQASAGVDASISPLNVLSDFNPSWAAKSPSTEPAPITFPSSFYPTSTVAAAAAGAAADADADAAAPGSDSKPEILPSQRRLAEITELIHTASLLHDDVIDHSESRRGAPSANLEFGNKMAVLAGDFLLGRASVALARLRNAEVVELLSTVIANLVEGEFMQLKNTARDERNPVWSEAALQYYLQKTYLKTASLISKSCRAAALLGGADTQTVDAAYTYGKNLGLAFQLVDDMLDYTRSAKELGKPAGADLELGLATAPLLFAWRENPELGALVGRKFGQPGDVARAREIVLASDGVERTRALAQDYAEQAIAAISWFPESEAKEGLIEMAMKTLKRKK